MASTALGEGRVTRERYRELVADGTIGADDRVELLDGVIVAMSPQNPAHAGVVGKLAVRLGGVTGPAAFVRVQSPLDLGRLSMPEPDLAVVPGHPDDYMAVHPTTALLVIEVAETSVIQDRLTKASLYAAAGVPEYLLVNLRDRCVEVRRRPIPHERRYAEVRVSGPEDTINLLAFPGVVLAVAEMLPPA
jgi:Uma2 family endonuclease